MKPVFFRAFAMLLCLACAALPLHAATAVQKELKAIVRPNVGLIGLSSSGELSRSTDSGATWTVVRAADATNALYTVGASGTTVIAMGDAGYFVRSTDNGLTWSALASPVNPGFSGSINAIAANGANWVAVGAQSGSKPVILHSENGGVSWLTATGVGAPGYKLNGVVWSGTGLGGKWVAVGESVFTADGYVTTSNSANGSAWNALTAPVSPVSPLHAVTSNGAGVVMVVGSSGTILRSEDHGTGFTLVADYIVSEAIRSVAFLSGTGWIAGTDNGGLVAINGSSSEIVANPTPTTPKAVTALISDGTATGYLYHSAAAAPAPHGPISLSIAAVAGQMQLTLVGAVTGRTYQLETSTTLTAWSVVPNSTRLYNSGAAPFWSFELPTTGRVFYRAQLVTP